MGPKLKQDEILEALLELKEGIASITLKLDNFETKLTHLSQSVKILESSVSKLEPRVHKHDVMINEREQHSRNSSVRVSGFKLPDESKDPMSVALHIYNSLLKPILDLAVESKSISSVPPMVQLIEFAHCLPSKQDPAPIIIRFQTRLLRQLVFKFKKPYFTKKKISGLFISEDLTALNFKYLRDLKNNDKVLKAWSINGKLKFILKENPDSVKSFRFDNFNDI